MIYTTNKTYIEIIFITHNNRNTPPRQFSSYDKNVLLQYRFTTLIIRRFQNIQTHERTRTEWRQKSIAQ